MNQHQQKNNLFIGDERRTFARNPAATHELEYLREQMLQTTCQEIADLYTMLRHKCTRDEQLLELVHYPAINAQTH